MRSTPLRLATTSVLLAALAGCGSSQERASVLEPPPAAAVAQVVPSVTAGRLGDATSVTSAGEQRVAEGGEIDADAGAPPAGVREGVDGAADCGAVDAEPTEATLDAVGESTLCLLNAERSSRGLAALSRNAKLDSAAGAHARDMVAKLFFGHQSPSGSAPIDRIRSAGYIPGDRAWTVGENLAWGSGVLATPAAIVRAWMNSQGHRENILKADYKEIGLGLVSGVPKAGIDGGATFATTFGGVEAAGQAASATSGSAAGAGQPTNIAKPVKPGKAKAKAKKRKVVKKKRVSRRTAGVGTRAAGRSSSAKRR